MGIRRVKRRAGREAFTRALAGEEKLKLSETHDGHLVPMIDEDRVAAAEAFYPNSDTEPEEPDDELVQANRERIEQLHQRRYGFPSIADDLTSPKGAALVVLVIAAAVAAAIGRADLAAYPIIGAVILGCLIAIGWSTRKRRFQRKSHS